MTAEVGGVVARRTMSKSLRAFASMSSASLIERWRALSGCDQDDAVALNVVAQGIDVSALHMKGCSSDRNDLDGDRQVRNDWPESDGREAPRLDVIGNDDANIPVTVRPIVAARATAKQDYGFRVRNARQPRAASATAASTSTLDSKRVRIFLSNAPYHSVDQSRHKLEAMRVGQDAANIP